MPFSSTTRFRLLVVLIAAVAVASLVGLISLTTDDPAATVADAPPAASPAPGPPPPSPVVPLPPPLPVPVPLPVPLPPVPTVLPPPVPRVPVPSPACTAPPIPVQRDVDTTDPADAVWPRLSRRRTVVYFETGQLPPRYARAVVEAAGLWSRSTCVEAVATPRCPPRLPCSTVVTAATGNDDGEDGNSESTTRDDVRVGNAITLYTVPLASSSENGVLGTVVHEMGHALGLRHRNDPRSIMNATTSDDADPRPDAIDFFNLAVLYGERSP